jgi:hypothetical protein
MTNRVHEYLDGEIPLEALSPEELAEVEVHLAVLERVIPHLRMGEDVDVRAKVMARIRGSTPGARPSENPLRIGAPSFQTQQTTNGVAGGALGWLWSPQPVPIRPVWGILSAAAVVFLMVSYGVGTERVDGIRGDASTQAEIATPAPPVVVYVQFRLEAPDASEVALVGSFTGWEPQYVLNRVADGSWSALVPLSPGIHDYGFVVDGTQWVIDPTAPRTQDGFGGENSRLALFPMTMERES